MHVIFLRQSLVQNKKRKQWPYKPGSVPLPLTAAVSVIYLLRMSPHGSSILPSDVSMLSGGQPSDDGLRELAASGWHAPPITRRPVVSYTHLLTLTVVRTKCLSHGGHSLLPYPAVTDSFHFQKRSALHCPDFPPAPQKCRRQTGPLLSNMQKYSNLAG